MCYQSHVLLGVSFKAGKYQDQQFLNTTINSFLSESAGAASHRTQLFVFVAGFVRKAKLARFLRNVSTELSHWNGYR